MNATLQEPTFLPSCTLAEGRRHRRGARDLAALAVTALDWAAVAVAALAFVAAGAAVWLG